MNITSLPDTREDRIGSITVGLLIDGAITRSINGRDIKQPRLEPCEAKVSCTVLRGRGGSNAALLPDKWCRFSFVFRF